MTNETKIGAVLTVLGIAAGAVVSAVLVHKPEAAGAVLYAGLAVCVACAVIGVFLLRKGGEALPLAVETRLPRIDLTDVDAKVDRNTYTGKAQFLRAKRGKVDVRDNRLSDD